jgi:thioredoxin-related protein
MGKMYQGTGQNLPNQIAYAFLNNNFMMPAIVFLDEKMNISGMINGYWHKSHFIPLFEYFNSDFHKKMTFQDYLKSPRS